MEQSSEYHVKEYNISSVNQKSVYFFKECMSLIQNLVLDDILTFDVLDISKNIMKIQICRNIRHPSIASNILLNLINLNEKKLMKTIRGKSNIKKQNVYFEEVLIEKGYVEYKWNTSRILIDLMKENDFYYNVYHPVKNKYKIDSKIQQIIHFKKRAFMSTAVKEQYCNNDVEYLSDSIIRMPFLEEIYIFSLYTTNMSLFYLCNSFKYIPNLRILWIDMMCITDMGISLICDNLKYITKLNSLKLYSNKITEEGCEKIVDSFHILSNLQELVIVTNQIPLQNNMNEIARDKHPNKNIHIHIHSIREDF